jgi:ABC-2 type transport system permease protein
VPAVAFDFPAALPWVGLAAALIVSMGAANLYGDDGTGLWPTRMVPGVERADVRGRQAAWLLVVAPAALALTAALTVLGGQGWAWPWLLAVLPAVLGGTAGLMMVVSVARPVRQKDPHRRSGPFDTGDDPNAAGALIGRQYLMLALAAACAVPGAVLVLPGGAPRPAGPAGGGHPGRDRHRGAAVLVGRPGRRPPPGRPRRRAAGPVPAGPQEAAAPERPGAAGPPLSRARSAARGVLLTAGILLIVPQGLVPIGFNLFGVDPQVRVWFAARYLPSSCRCRWRPPGRRRCARPLVGRPHRAPRETFLSVSR